ncbi:DUF4181 domain-containing protein [Bacillus sp. AK128]
MGFILITIAIICFFIIDKVMQRKLNTPKRGWTWYKHDHKGFATLFYIIFILIILLPFIFPEVNLFLLFPFAGTLINILFTIEKLIFQRETKLYLNYLLDASFWFVLGVIAYIFF